MLVSSPLAQRCSVLLLRHVVVRLAFSAAITIYLMSTRGSCHQSKADVVSFAPFTLLKLLQQSLLLEGFYWEMLQNVEL